MKYRVPNIIVCALCAPFIVKGQSMQGPLARAVLGNTAYSSRQADLHAAFFNKAAIASFSTVAFGIYGERRYMVNELSSCTGIAILPGRYGHFGVSMSYAGFSGYSETMLGLAYAKRLGRIADIALQFSYNGARIPAYGNSAAAGSEVAVLLHLTSNLQTGISISNPAGGRFGKNSGEKLPAQFAAGFGFDVSDRFLVTAELVKQEDVPMNVNVSFNYVFIDRAVFRAGIGTATSLLCVGVGIILQALRLDFTIAWHPQLGITPGLLISFPGKGREQKEGEPGY